MKSIKRIHLRLWMSRKDHMNRHVLINLEAIEHSDGQEKSLS